MDLNEFKVKELSSKDLKRFNGGWLLWVIGTLIYLYDNKDDLIEGFKEGYKAAKESKLIHL